MQDFPNVSDGLAVQPRILWPSASRHYNLHMLDLHRFTLFLAAAVLLAITPGPGIFYVLARSLGGGRREGVNSSLGTFVGGMFHVFAAALGVSAISRGVRRGFSHREVCRRRISRVDGCADDSQPQCGDADRRCGSRPGAFRQGIFTEALNPKTALFFLSFIPQFIAPDRGHVFLQFVVLGMTSVVLNTFGGFAGGVAGRATRKKIKKQRAFPQRAARSVRRRHDWSWRLRGNRGRKVESVRSTTLRNVRQKIGFPIDAASSEDALIVNDDAPSDGALASSRRHEPSRFGAGVVQRLQDDVDQSRIVEFRTVARGFRSDGDQREHQRFMQSDMRALAAFTMMSSS